AVRDLADLLDVDVDQLAGGGALVAQRRGLRGTDELTGQRVALTQVGHLVAAQDRTHSAGGDPQLGPDPVLTAALVAAHLEDSLLDPSSGAPRATVRARGAVAQAGIPFEAKPGDPTVGALSGDPQLFGHVRNGPTVLDHARDQQTPTVQIQTGISVGHEDLLGKWAT